MDRKGVIFDMDGVLLDSAPYHFESWKRLAEEEGLPPVTKEWFQTTFGRTAREILPDLFHKNLEETKIRRLVDRKEALYREAIDGKVKPMPGLWRLIQKLHEHAWRLGVGSSGPRQNVELVIDQLDLRGLLDGYVSADDVENGKPDPEVFLRTARKMKVHPEHCVVFEDAAVGVQAALAAGMRAVALTSTHPRAKLENADRVIDAFSEISPHDLEALLDGQ
jgi:beta-phosphoglucomutase